VALNRAIVDEKYPQKNEKQNAIELKANGKTCSSDRNYYFFIPSIPLRSYIALISLRANETEIFLLKSLIFLKLYYYN
jgi:hypothetical protein